MSIDQNSTPLESSAPDPVVGGERATAGSGSPFKRSSKNRPYWARTAGAVSSDDASDLVEEAEVEHPAQGRDTNGMSIADSTAVNALRDSGKRTGRVGQRPMPAVPLSPEAQQGDFAPSNATQESSGSLDHLAEFAPPPPSRPAPVAPSMALAPLSYDYGTVGQSVTRKEYVTSQYLRAAAIASSQQRKPVYKRLTPFAWVMMTLGAGAVISGLVFAGRILMPASSEAASAKFAQPVIAERAASEAATAVVVEPTVAPAVTATVAPTAVPTRAKPTATRVDPTAVPTLAPTAETQPTAAPTEAETEAEAAQPAAVATADVVTWASTMVQPSVGVFMAPENVVADTRQSVIGYYQSLKQHKTPADATRDLVDNQEVFLGQYFEGLALAQLKQQLTDAPGLGVLEQGDVAVKIVSYSADGATAEAIVEQRGFTSKVYEKPRLVFWTQRRLPDQDLRVRLRYSISDNRWRVSEVIETVAVKRTRTPSTSVGSKTPATRQRRVIPTAVPTAPTPADAAAPVAPEEPVVELPTNKGAAIPPAP